jgi:ABC-2 type transporter
MGCVGAATVFLFAAVIKKEIAVRDTVFLCIFLMLLLSGFPFQIPYIRSYFGDLTQINPMRWCFEALMNWKFVGYYQVCTPFV